MWAGILSLVACLIFFALAAGGKIIVGEQFNGDLLVTPAYVFLLVFVNVAAGPTVLRVVARVLVAIAVPIASIAKSSLGSLAQEMTEDEADDDDMMQALPHQTHDAHDTHVSHDT